MSLSKRILLNSIVILSILYLPWYIVAVLGIIFQWKYGMPELILHGFLMDMVYGSMPMHSYWILPWTSLWIFPFLPFTIGALVSVFVLNLFKKRVRFV